ncbi:MAG: GDSL-type esterase/lipase family protein [Peptoanaerobacter stomatis]|uniref:GDSL-type esterase/lipase family protein n=1 Tax=Peptoanaerobacter stomatis TaxID=796937 RepID=UPI003FA10EE7
MNNICLIDCLKKTLPANDFLTLGLWGKFCYEYPIKAAIETNIFYHIYVITDSLQIKEHVSTRYCNIKVVSTIKNIHLIHGDYICFLSGYAPLVSSSSLISAINLCRQHKTAVHSVINSIDENITIFEDPIFKEKKINAFKVALHDDTQINIGKTFVLPEEEGIVINSKNDFELALILLRKKNKDSTIVDMLIQEIKEKQKLFSTGTSEDCLLIGHSQFAQWNTQSLKGMPVRNCAISGISSFQYNNFILKPKLLNCCAKKIIVMHGTNDIVYNCTFDEILQSINNTLDYIKMHSNNPIYFVLCLPVNGRLDRSNDTINKLNFMLKKNLPDDIIRIDVSDMQDQYGDLNQDFTSDGLHLNEYGYKKFQSILEEYL